MLYYLDTNIVMYAVEGQPPFRQRARNHIAALENAGHRFVISELTWTECLVIPLRTGDGPLLLDYERFFLGPKPYHCSRDIGGPSPSGADPRHSSLWIGGLPALGDCSGVSPRPISFQRQPSCWLS